jgi:hypothetical protein
MLGSQYRVLRSGILSDKHQNNTFSSGNNTLICTITIEIKMTEIQDAGFKQYLAHNHERKTARVEPTMYYYQ